MVQSDVVRYLLLLHMFVNRSANPFGPCRAGPKKLPGLYPLGTRGRNVKRHVMEVGQPSKVINYFTQPSFALLKFTKEQCLVTSEAMLCQMM